MLFTRGSEMTEERSSTRSWCGAHVVSIRATFGDVLPTILCTLNNLEHCLDPAIARADFVEWFATWVGATVDENWPDAPRRAAVAHVPHTLEVTAA